MTITDNEAIASLKVLAAVLRADGKVHEAERKSLVAALGAFQLPEGLEIAGLLEEDVDLDAQLAVITSDEAREQVYKSAWFMAHADGACSKEEEAMLARIASATQASAATTERLSLTFAKPKTRFEALADGLRGLLRSR
jgi:uncharacterized tellurite resistance protein B-like protein